MRISDIVSICWRNLTRRKMRTALSALGVVIGVCAILVMISIGIGLQVYYDNMLSSWGDLTVINVYNYGGMAVMSSGGGYSSSSSSAGTLDDEVVEELYTYFREEAQSDSLTDALEELGNEYEEEEIRLVRLKFLSEVAN